MQNFNNPNSVPTHILSIALVDKDNKDNTFPKTYKLTNPEVYKNLLGTRPKFKTQYLNIHILPNNITHARLGFIISKKMCKKANMRNQLKRIIREIFRHNKYKLGNIDILFRLKTNINFFTKSDYTNQKIILQRIIENFQ